MAAHADEDGVFHPEHCNNPSPVVTKVSAAVPVAASEHGTPECGRNNQVLDKT